MKLRFSYFSWSFSTFDCNSCPFLHSYFFLNVWIMSLWMSIKNLQANLCTDMTLPSSWFPYVGILMDSPSPLSANVIIECPHKKNITEMFFKSRYFMNLFEWSCFNISFFNMLFCEASYSCVSSLSDLRKFKKSYIQLFTEKQTSLLNGEPRVPSCLICVLCAFVPCVPYMSCAPYAVVRFRVSYFVL